MNHGFSERQGEKVAFIGVLAFFLAIALCLSLVPAASLKAAQTQAVPDEILIENKIYRTDRKGFVRFSHLEHAEGYVEACEACHHEYKEGQNVWQEGQPVKKCVTCHDPSKRQGNARKLNIAFHKNCKGCHKKLAREGGTDAPYRQCTDCHAKR
jgi:Class III cytochrome C family